MKNLTIADSKRLMSEFLTGNGVGDEIIEKCLLQHNAYIDMVQSSIAQVFPVADWCEGVEEYDGTVYLPRVPIDVSDDYVLPFSPEVAALIPLKIAALAVPIEQAELSLRLLQLYEGEIARLRNVEEAQDG